VLTLLVLMACPTPSSVPSGAVDAVIASTPTAALGGTPAAAGPPVDEALTDAASYLSGGRGLDEAGIAGDDNQGQLINGVPGQLWNPSMPERRDLIVQFAQAYDLATITLVNGSSDGTATKELGIDVGPAFTGPWTEVAALTLAQGKALQAFPLSTANARYVRLRLVSNYGDPNYLALDDVHLLGKRSVAENGDLTGFYVGQLGEAMIKQTGSVVTGCSNEGQFRFEGTVEDGVVFGTWRRMDGEAMLGSGPIVFARTVEGDVSGALGDESTDGGRAIRWDGIRQAEGGFDCDEQPGPAVDPMEAGLKTGRLKVYGITFDTAKDTIKPESTPTLESLAKALKAGGGQYTIDGHTDSQGADDYNQGLSERRAASVKAWLVAHGIPDASLTTAGFGESAPIQPNDTPGGRAANRRIEVAVTSG
jgi:outer membrane protein OmpA-like peptidoglycan-associated protein